MELGVSHTGAKADFRMPVTTPSRFGFHVRSLGDTETLAITLHEYVPQLKQLLYFLCRILQQDAEKKNPGSSCLSDSTPR